MKYELTCAALKGFTLRVLPSGRKSYYVRYRTADGRDIRERIGSVAEVSLADARAYARSRLAEVAAPRRAALSSSRRSPLPSRPPTVRAFATRFLLEHADVRLKRATREKYRQLLRTAILPRFGELHLDEVTRAEVIRWHGEQRATPYEANAALLLLSSMYGRAKDWEVVDAAFTSPTRNVKKFPGTPRERFLTPEERGRLDEALERGLTLHRNEQGALRWESVAAIRLLALTGMRRAEVCGLTWPMVDWRHRCLRLPDSKTGKRTVPLSDGALDLLGACQRRAESRRGRSEYIVPNRDGAAIRPSTLTATWIRVRDRLPGFERVRLHDLRHSAASDAINAGVPLAIVGRILGHRKPSTTARYAHISDQALAEGVRLMGAAIEANTRPRPRRRRAKKKRE